MRSRDYRKLKHIVDRITGIEGVLAVILFGSHARGDAHEGSDIDLLVLFAKSAELVRGREIIIRVQSKENLFMQIISLTVEEFQRSNLLDIVLREGKVLYSEIGLMRLISSRLKPFSLLTYSTAKLNEKERVMFAQSLEGRGRGRYKYRGLIHHLGGFKVGRGVLMIPTNKLSQISRYFADRNVDYTIRNVWSVS